MKKTIALILSITCVQSVVFGMQFEQPFVLSITLSTGTRIQCTEEDLVFKLHHLCTTQPTGIGAFDSQQNHILPLQPTDQVSIRNHILRQLAAVADADEKHPELVQVDVALIKTPLQLISDTFIHPIKHTLTPSILSRCLDRTTLQYAACIGITYLLTKHIHQLTPKGFL